MLVSLFIQFDDEFMAWISLDWGRLGHYLAQIKPNAIRMFFPQNQSYSGGIN
jgi:hypothetical protein